VAIMAPKAALLDYGRTHLRYRRSLSIGEKEVLLRYTGPDRANVDYHHGALRPAVGVQSYQVLRANREHPEEAEDSMPLCIRGWDSTWRQTGDCWFWDSTGSARNLTDRGGLCVEVWDCRGRIPVRLVLDSDGWIKVYHGRRTDSVVSYEAGKWYDIDLKIDVTRHQFEVMLNGQPTGSNQSYQGQPFQASGWYFLNSDHTVGRLVFRSGPVRRKPDVDTGVEDQGEDLPDAGVPDQAARYFINRVRTTDHRITEKLERY